MKNTNVFVKQNKFYTLANNYGNVIENIAIGTIFNYMGIDYKIIKENSNDINNNFYAIKAK